MKRTREIFEIQAVLRSRLESCGYLGSFSTNPDGKETSTIVQLEAVIHISS